MRIETITTEPETEPVLPSEVKSQAQITTPEDDFYIADVLIPAARQWAEDYMGRALHSQSWTLYLDRWATEIMLARHPVLDVTSIKYIDVNNAQQTLGTDIYRVDKRWGRITEADGKTWPTLNNGITNAVEIEYRAGYVDTAASPETGTIPHPIKHAILMLCAHWYGPGREPTSEMRLQDVPFTVSALLDRYRVYQV